jgi:glycosyltransferase involved in cell wall biosynthesis
MAQACILYQIMVRQGIGHVHAHFGTNSATVAMLAHILGGVTFSFTVHGPEEFDKAAQWALDEKIMRAAFVIAISHFGRSQLLRQCAHPQWGKIHVVRCGVDGAFLDAPARPVPTTPKLVSIGRLSEQKGQLLLVEAIARLRRQRCSVTLDLVGDGELRPDIEQAIARHGLSDCVRITGWADGDTIRQALDASSALVLPSFAEGLPVVIMEAMARARPVLSTYVAGIPELVRPGENGWLVAAGSVEDLAHALGEVVATPPWRLEEMGQNGRRRVAEHHDSRRIGVELAALMRAPC